MSINLTTNAIPKIMAGDLNQKPLLQILDITPIGHAKERYRIVLSDSTTFQTGMIATQCNQLARNGLVRKGFVVQLIDYIYLREAAYILGIKIYRDRSQRLIGLCQSAYIEKILKGFHMENSKHGSIPMQENPRLSKSEDASMPAELKHMQNVPYASSVGSIMYAVRCTRPDVAFAQNITSRFQQNPDADDLKSQIGYVFVLNGGAVDWKSAKQSIFATSSAEAKYITAYDASKEAVWVRKFIYGLVVVPTIEEPINMYCDNTGAIAIAKESGITKGARHFHAKVHYLREVIEFGDIKLEKVHTDDNVADPFTKALAFPKHSEHTRNIGMLPASSLM
ncbi:retrotransposon protein, putative, ty1-copia subclass [Tanacetum coccineum]